jgi:hypothetical protein
MGAMDIGSSTVAFLIGFLLVGAYLWDRGKWNRKTNEELVATAAGSDWKHWKNAMVELQQRGVDIQPFVPNVAARLLAESMMERQAARITLGDLFSDWNQQLTDCGYTAAQAPAEARQRLAPVFGHFNVPLP